MEDKVIKLNLSISPEDQIKLIESVKRRGGIAPVESQLTDPFWIGEGFRMLDFREFPDLPDEDRGRLPYLTRLHPGVQWEWLEDHPLVPMLKKLIEPLMPGIRKLNRVTSIVQIPGKEVPAHRDLIVGNTYPNMKSETETLLGSHTLEFKGDGWYQKMVKAGDGKGLHEKQSYFGLRIPITEKPGDNGRPFLQDPTGRKKRYDTGRNFFLLDEASVEHGADPVDFYRGVIIVDGELDLSFFKNEQSEAFRSYAF